MGDSGVAAPARPPRSIGATHLAASISHEQWGKDLQALVVTQGLRSRSSETSEVPEREREQQSGQANEREVDRGCRVRVCCCLLPLCLRHRHRKAGFSFLARCVALLLLSLAPSLTLSDRHSLALPLYASGSLPYD